MKCKECIKEGKKSTVYPVVSTTTLMAGYGYYDEYGNYHYSDPNTTTTEYKCSNGYEWVKTIGGFRSE